MGSYLHYRDVLLEFLHLFLHAGGYVQAIGNVFEVFLQLV